MTKADMQVRPVRTEEDYRIARQKIEVLIESAHSASERDELDVLATLVDAYEAKQYTMDAPSPIAAIEFRMDQQGLTRKDLEPFLGSRARVSEVMTGRRPLTLPMIQRLRAGLGIPADVLIGPLRKGTRRVEARTARRKSSTVAADVTNAVAV